MIYAVLEGKNLEIENILSSREEAERYLQSFYGADDDVVVISARDKESLDKEIARRLSPTKRTASLSDALGWFPHIHRPHGSSAVVKPRYVHDETHLSGGKKILMTEQTYICTVFFITDPIIEMIKEHTSNLPLIPKEKKVYFEGENGKLSVRVEQRFKKRYIRTLGRLFVKPLSRGISESVVRCYHERGYVPLKSAERIDLYTTTRWV